MLINRGFAPLAILTAMLPIVVGCTDPGAESGSSRLLRSGALGQGGGDFTSKLGVTRHFLGRRITDGREIHHRFELTNFTNKPVKLYKAEAQKPCCSTIVLSGKEVQPGSIFTASVSLKPGQQSGLKEVAFYVNTDSGELPTIALSLSAELVPEFAIIPAEGSDHIITLGQSGKQRYRIICHRSGATGLRAPETVIAPSPLSASFIGGTAETRHEGDIVESIRQIEVVTPAATKLGANTGTISLGWDDGSRRSHRVQWTVVPLIRVSPAGILADPARGRQGARVVIRGEDRPFRIMRVDGPLLPESRRDFPTKPGKAHSLVIRLADHPGNKSLAEDVIFFTDHPAQPHVALSVLYLPEGTAR
jgi:hypothetical protein